MAHPYASHSETKVAKRRAGGFVKGFKRGGAAKHSDEAADRKLFSKMIKKHEAEEKVEGKASGGRLDKFARGGRTKKKHDTQVNIAVVAPHGHHPSDAGALPGGPTGAPPRPPIGGAAVPPGPPPGGPPLAGPPGLPPGMMPPGGPVGMKPPGMMNRGGKVKKFARGGKLGMTAGADTGPGRLQKSKKYNARKA